MGNLQIGDGFMYGQQKSAALQAYHQGAIENFINENFAKLGKQGVPARASVKRPAGDSRRGVREWTSVTPVQSMRL